MAVAKDNKTYPRKSTLYMFFNCPRSPLNIASFNLPSPRRLLNTVDPRHATLQCCVGTVFRDTKLLNSGSRHYWDRHCATDRSLQGDMAARLRCVSTAEKGGLVTLKISSYIAQYPIFTTIYCTLDSPTNLFNWY